MARGIPRRKSAWKRCCSTLPETLKHSLWVASKLKGQIPSAHDDKLPQLTTLIETQPPKRSIISHRSANRVTCTELRHSANKSRLMRKPSGPEMPELPRYIQRSGLIFLSISYGHRDVEGTGSKNSLPASIYRTHKAKPQIHFSHNHKSSLTILLSFHKAAYRDKSDNDFQSKQLNLLLEQFISIIWQDWAPFHWRFHAYITFCARFMSLLALSGQYQWWWMKGNESVDQQNIDNKSKTLKLYYMG